MDSHAVHSAEPHQLAKLLNPDSEAPTIYHGTDPGRILRDQLQAPLSEELSSSIAGMRVQMDLAPAFRTFDDLFHDSNPPIDALKRAKDYAKTCRGNHELLPSEVATVLYYAALAAARVHLDESITHLSDEEFGKGLQWAVSQGWVDEKTKGLFREGLGKVK